MKGLALRYICMVFTLIPLHFFCFWYHNEHLDTIDRTDFSKGSIQDVSINNKGEIRLSPIIEAVAGIKGAFVWSIASDLQNRVFAGTGDPGAVYLIKDGLEAVELFKSPELYIQSLAADKSGNLYAGTAPRGIIYKINTRGEAVVFCSLPVPYIWDMSVDSNSDLFAATGNDGILFKISPDGIPAVFFDRRRPISWMYSTTDMTISMLAQNRMVWYIK